MQTKGGAPVLPGRAREEGGAAPPFRPTRRPMPAEPAAALPPRSAPRSEHAARWECSVSETPRAAADGDAATTRKTPRPPRRPGKEKGGFEENAPPGPTPPHAASRTLFRTKKSVRSDAHYVGKTGLHLSRARQGGALPCFARPAARCRPSQTRHCRRVVRLGANTLHGGSAACPKRRVRRRTVTRPPRAKLPAPRAARAKKRAALRKMLRPAQPHRTRHPGHFSGQRKVSVLMRTTWGKPGSASAGCGRTRPLPG